jgi:hypothetical protein
LITVAFLSGCAYQRRVTREPLNLPEKVYVKTNANLCSPSKVGIFRFSEPKYAPKTGKIAAEALYEELIRKGVFPNVVSEIERDDINKTRMIDFAQSQRYDLIITGDLLYYFDGSDLTSSRVEEAVRVIHVPTNTTLWVASTTEAELPVFPTDFVVVHGKGAPAPATTKLLEKNAEKFCKMFQEQAPKVFLPCRDTDGDGVSDEMDHCPDTPRGIKVNMKGCPVNSDGDRVPDYLDRCPDTPKGVEVDEYGCPVDSDGDRVPDYLDKCPDTPKGVEVDENGCPVDSDGDRVPDYLDRCPDTPKGVEVGENGCPVDSDGDVVPDYLDKCPDTPKGVEVDEYGCPVDSDGDGVPDYLDKCPRTPKDVSVNDVGCWVCKGVLFDFRHWNIKPEFYPNLDKVVEVLKNTSFHLEVQGHTDNIGTEKYNEWLSQKRASSVISYLIRKGISRKRLHAKGFGFSKPVASNETEEGRQKNRRVQFNPIYGSSGK